MADEGDGVGVVIGGDCRGRCVRDSKLKTQDSNFETQDSKPRLQNSGPTSKFQTSNSSGSVKTSDFDSVRSKAASFAAAAAMAAQTKVGGTRGSSKDEVIDSALEASKLAAQAALAAVDTTRKIAAVIKSLQEL